MNSHKLGDLVFVLFLCSFCFFGFNINSNADGVGSGTLTISNDGLCQGDGFDCKVNPHHFDIFPTKTVHINISPAFNICTSGNHLHQSCSVDSDCNYAGTCTGQIGNKVCNNQSGSKSGQPCVTNANCVDPGTCDLALECAGDTNVIVKAHDNTPCTENADCNGQNETECDQDLGFCKVHYYIATQGRVGDDEDIDVCWTVPEDICSGGVIAYCDDVGLISNANHPINSDNYSAANIRPVDVNILEGSQCDDPVENPRHEPLECGGQQGLADCSNEVGSFCCGLTQGAYGAPKSIATNLGNENCAEPEHMGFIPLADCQGCDVFDGDPNATTIGIHGLRAVTINNLLTLEAYLPSGGTPKKFKTSWVGSDTHYSTPSQIPDKKGSGSGGQGGGSLSGQAMACRLNSFLSDCVPPFGGSGTFTADGFGGFELPEDGVLLCTQRSGGDKVLQTSDDICEAFSFPSCVAGLTVGQVLQCANQQLATGNNACGCSAGLLTYALNNINYEFDQCGMVIECPQQITSKGAFTCP